MDPFLPLQREDERRSQHLAHTLHEAFTGAVMSSRQDRLKFDVAKAKAEAFLADATGSDGAAPASAGTSSSGGDEEEEEEEEEDVGAPGARGVFDGSFYAGDEALEIGMADSLGHLHTVCKERFGANVWLRPYKTKTQNPFGNLMASVGAGFVQAAVVEAQNAHVEARTAV